MQDGRPVIAVEFFGEPVRSIAVAVVALFAFTIGQAVVDRRRRRNR